jgi:hypothetical protein
MLSINSAPLRAAVKHANRLYIAQRFLIAVLMPCSISVTLLPTASVHKVQVLANGMPHGCMFLLYRISKRYLKSSSSSLLLCFQLQVSVR